MALKRETEKLNCSDCETESATGLCTTCQLTLCDYCVGYHKRSTKYKDHVIQSVEAVSNEDLFEKQIIRCSDHSQEVKYFCQDCQTSICVDCVVAESHKGHVFQSLGQVIVNELTSVRKSLDDSNCVVKKYDEILEMGEKFQTESKKELDSSRKLVKDTFAVLRTMMEVEEEKLLAWLDDGFTVSAAALEDAKQMTNHVKSLKTHLQDVVRYPASEVFDVLQVGGGWFTNFVARMKDVHDSSSEDALEALRNMSFMCGENDLPIQEDKLDLKLVAHQVKRNDEMLNNLQTSIRDMKNIFTLNRCLFPSSSIRLSLTVPIKSFSCQQHIYSEPVLHGEFSWKMWFRFRAKYGLKMIEIYIQCESRNVTKTWNVPARYKVTLKNHVNDDIIQDSLTPQGFTEKEPSMGWSWFHPVLDVVDPTKGFLKDDSISMTAEIIVLNASVR